MDWLEKVGSHFTWKVTHTMGSNPIHMPLCASTGPVLGPCCQHRTSSGPVLATNGMFTGKPFMIRETLQYFTK